MTDIEKYYQQLCQEVTSRQLANEDGDTQEQTFTRLFLDLLSEAGETENTTVAYDEKDFGTKKTHKIKYAKNNYLNGRKRILPRRAVVLTVEIIVVVTDLKKSGEN